MTVALTPRGRRRLAARRRSIAAKRSRLFERLTRDEREHAERLLRHLAELLGEL